MQLPIPPGFSEVDLHRDSTVLLDYGDCVALYSAEHGMGGIYRHNPGIWQLWFPIEFDDFTKAISQFLVNNGMADRARFSDFHAVPSMRLN